MFGKSIKYWVVSLSGLTAALTGAMITHAATPIAGDTAAVGRPNYTFGVVPQFEQRKLFRIWRPLLDEIGRRTGVHLELTGSPKIPVFEKRFMRGDFDFAYMNPYHVALGSQAQGYIPLVRDGERRLKGIVVVHKDSALQNIAQLQGAAIAMPSPNALGASLLPRADFLAQGIDVSPVYVQTHSSVYLHVATGITPAGSGVHSTLRRQPQAIREKLRIIYTSREVAPHPVAAHPRVPEADRERVREAFLELMADEAGRRLLAAIPMANPTTATIQDYLPLLGWGLDKLFVDAQ